MGNGTLVLLGNDPAGRALNDVFGVRAAMGYDIPSGQDESVQAPPSPAWAQPPSAGPGVGWQPVTEERKPEKPGVAPERAQGTPAQKPQSPRA